MSIVPDPQDLPSETPASSAAASEGALAATAAALHSEAHRHGAHGPFHTHCENCGTKLDGPFCHRCGQHDFEFHRSFRHVVFEALESFFHFEGKFFRNIVTLLFRPGRLTADFNAGKRASQMPPFRLYVFVSVFFFFLVFLSSAPGPTSTSFSSTAAPGKGESSIPVVPPAAAPSAANATDLKSAAADLQERAERARSEAGKRQPEVRRVRIEGSENSALLHWIEKLASRASDAGYQAKLSDSFLHSIPRLLLLCLPLFALYARLLFRKSGWVYLQHLVLALHFHTFVYLWILFRDGWVFLADFVSSPLSRLVWVGCLGWLMVYPFLMLRGLFRNSWPRTLLKTGALGLAYLFTLIIGFVVGLVVLLVTM